MRLLALSLMVLLFPLPLRAGDVPGQFDYYVLSLSWQPGWCSATGDARNAPECRKGTTRAFGVHGLWPQHERGWPQDCAVDERDPSRRETQGMTDIMGSAGLALHQWRKHGRCSGLSAADYYLATRQALDSITIPTVFQQLPQDVTLPPSVVEEAFLELNHGFGADGITVTCRDGALAELRLCLTRDLQPRDCAPDVRRDCTASRILMEAPH
ncbi:ribonuclease T2 family protein [Paracoccus sp. (in: a-proteobacteria)]|uniref:ribonuclease T2 family protein n=1 Tax=Paracoccus sp. TaxID=267 RepID=UPI00396CA576